MSLKVAVQMDPIGGIKIAGDSTFALMLEAQARGHQLVYYTPHHLFYENGSVKAHVQPVKVQDVEGAHAQLSPGVIAGLTEFDVVLLRQDPPFDIAYITSTHLLERIQEKTLVVNDPVCVRNAPEKMFVLNFSQFMPETLITRTREDIEAFRRAYGDIVMKPLHGNGGAGVFVVKREDPNFGSLFDMFSATFREPWMVQRFLPQVREGDKRIILIDGEFGGALNRVPAENDIRANLVRGGSGAATELTQREKEICEALKPHLKKMGLLFTGIDVIGGYLTEINVTSPTGLRAIKKVSGVDLVPRIWDAIEAKLG